MFYLSDKSVYTLNTPFSPIWSNFSGTGTLIISPHILISQAHANEKLTRKNLPFFHKDVHHFKPLEISYHLFSYT